MILRSLSKMSLRTSKLWNLILTIDFSTELPEDIWDLPRLSTLHCYENVKELPSKIVQLSSSLECIWVEYSFHIRSLPAALFDLSHLTDLRFNISNLEYLPPSIGNLVNLKTLEIRGDPSVQFEFPPSLGNLVNLKYFLCYEDVLSRLPSSCYTNWKIEQLDVSIH